MKITRHPTNAGNDWWIVVHDLAVAGSSYMRVRPIHVFTYLAQHLPGLGDNKKHVFNYCHALENKLFAVRYQHFELRKAMAEWNDLIYRNEYLREYEDQQKVICVLEALLNSIYSVLEIVSQINKVFHPELPEGFRRQAKKDQFFSFKKWPWLGLFYDIRPELEHYSTSLPQMHEQALVFEIVKKKKLFTLDQGRWKMPFTNFLAFSIDLFNMLDKWALSEIAKLDPEISLDSIRQTRPQFPLAHEKVKVKDILVLIEAQEKRG